MVRVVFRVRFRVRATVTIIELRYEFKVEGLGVRGGVRFKVRATVQSSD